MTWRENGELRQIERRSLLQIGNSFFDSFTLGGGACLWIQGNVAAFFGGSEYRGQFHSVTPVKKVRLALILVRGNGAQRPSSARLPGLIGQRLVE